MRSHSFLALASLAITANAATIGSRTGESDFQLKQVTNPQSSGPNVFRDILKTYGRYKFNVPQEQLQFLSQAAAAGGVPATDVTTSSSTTGPSPTGGAINKRDTECRPCCKKKCILEQYCYCECDWFDRKCTETSAAPAGETGSAVSLPGIAASAYDNDWVVPVQIGTPPQTLFLQLDTGSSDLWVFSTETNPADLYQNNLPTVWNPSLSSTQRKMNGYSWFIEYADGSGAQGDVYTDVVSIGGVSFPNQTVESAQFATGFMDSPELSGLLGLAPSDGNTVLPVPQLTFLDNIKDNLSSPLFTADMRHQQPGTFNFGYIDQAAYTGTIGYSPADFSTGYWQINLSGYQVMGSTYNLFPCTDSFPCASIADTGTSLLFLPDKVCKDYYANVAGSSYDSRDGLWLVPCAAALPDFIFGIGSYRGTVPGRYFNFGPYSGSKCVGGLQSSQGSDLNVLGDVLLKAQFVVFDSGNPTQVGFASKVLTS